MKKWTQFIFLLLLLFVFASCKMQQQLYYPNRANEPTLNHAGEAKVNLSYDNAPGGELNSARNINSFSAEVAYSPINHLGIIGSYRTMYNGNSAYYRLHQGELGAGYYLPFGKRKRGLFELYGGADLGNMNAHNYYDSSNNFRAAVTARFNDIFLQPAVGYRSKHFSIMYGNKFLGRKFGNINFIDNPYDTLSSSRYLFLQPFVNITYGFKNFQLNIQSLSSVCLNEHNLPPIDHDENRVLPFFFPLWGNPSISIGLTIFITKDMFDFKWK